MKKYEEMTSKELKAAAKEAKISGWWDMRKDQLIAALRELEFDAVGFDDVEAPAEIEINDKPIGAEKVYKDVPIPPKSEALIPKRGQLLEFNGKAQNICAWAKELGISANTLYGRIYKLGWPIEKAFIK